MRELKSEKKDSRPEGEIRRDSERDRDSKGVRDSMGDRVKEKETVS